MQVRREEIAPRLVRYVFTSDTRPGTTHELLLDLDDPGPGRLSCLCEAALHGRVCKHKRAVMRIEAGERVTHPR